MLIRLTGQTGQFDLIPNEFTVTEGTRRLFADVTSASQFLAQFRYHSLAMRRLDDLHSHIFTDSKRYLDEDILLKKLAPTLVGLSGGRVAVIEREDDDEQSRWQGAGGWSSALPSAISTALTRPAVPQSRPITARERQRWAEALETKPVPEQKYKIVIEVAGKQLKPLVGWLDLRPIPNGDDYGHSAFFSRDTGRDAHRVVLHFDNVPNQPRRLYYVIGTYHFPLSMNITPVEREADAQQWSNVLIPLIPVCKDSIQDSPEPTNSPERTNDTEPTNSPELTNSTKESAGEFKMLPPGWLYVYLNGHLWREVQVCNDAGVLRDVCLSRHAGKHQRPATGQVFKLLVVPYKLNGVTQTVQLAYSPQQWTWTQLCQAGGINPDDRRFLPPLKQRSANIPVDTAFQERQLTTLDLSSYEQGFDASNDSGQPGHAICPVATAPKIMDEELPPWPAVDRLEKFRQLNIPVVALDIAPQAIPDNWIELQFAPGHRYTVQDTTQRGFEQSGSLDNNGFARITLPPDIVEVNFWFETAQRPWYFDAPLQVAGGVRDAGQEVLDVTFELGAWLESILPLGVMLVGDDAPNGYLGYVFPWEDNYAEAQRQLEVHGNTLNLPKVAKPETLAGSITNDVSQFLVGFIPAMKAVTFIQPTTKTGALVKGMAVGAVVDATVFDPHEARLSDLLQQYPALRNPVTEYLKSDPADTNAQGRFKLALEGLILGAVAERFISALKVIKYARMRHFVQKARVKLKYDFKLEKKAGSGGVPNNFGEIYSKAPAAKLEIDSMSDEIAEMFGGQVAKAPIKSQERAIQKIMNDYGGDAIKIKDLARNTIIVSPEKMDSVVAELAKRGANVKVINGAIDPLGYSGVNSTIKTQAGIVGEVQVNTPAMIYAKESESMASALLGDDLYRSIAEKSGIPGGQGHKLYEQWRNLPESGIERSKIEAQSKAYYDAMRRSIYGN